MGLFKKIKNTKLWLPATIIVLMAINWLAAGFHTRLDFTNEKRFTLSTPTKNILKNLDSIVQINIFLKGELPSGFKKLSISSNELLSEFKEIAHTKLQYNFINPDEEMQGTTIKWADTLSGMGLFPINLKLQLKAGEEQQLLYPFALVQYKQKIIPVTLYEGTSKAITYSQINSAEAMMEYKFADAIYKLTQSQKPLLAYSLGNGEPTDVRTYDLVNNILTKDFNLKTINLNTQPAIPDTFKLLMIVKPTKPFTDEEKLKIDQFVMRGGKLLLFIDKLEAEMDSLSLKNEVVAYDRQLALDDLLFKYGVRINSDLVMDLQCDFFPFITNGSAQMEYLHWNYFPLFETKSNHVINKNIGLVAGQFVNSIDTVEADGIKKTILLSSSPNAKTIATPALISGKENINAPQDDKFKKANIAVAVLLEGSFQSLFSNRLSQSLNDSLKKYGYNFLSKSGSDGKIIVVADGDMVLNSADKNGPLPMGVNRYTAETQYQYQFANKDFVQNCLSYLINASGLSEAKAKDYTLRLLDAKKVSAQKSIWQLINIALPILVVIAFAIIYAGWRKKKYTT